MMFCKECGKPIPDDSMFCPECGAKIVEAPPPPAAAPPPTPPPGHPATPIMAVQQQQPQQAGNPVNQGLNIGVIVGSLIIPLIGIIMGVIYLKDSAPERKKAGKTWLWVGIAAAVFWIFFNLSGNNAMMDY